MIRRENQLCDRYTWNIGCGPFWISGGNYFGNPEKGMKNAFSAPHNEMKCVLCIKESYSKEKKVKIFTFAYGQAGSDILNC